jgi:hypothetical protein
MNALRTVAIVLSVVLLTACGNTNNKAEEPIDCAALTATGLELPYDCRVSIAGTDLETGTYDEFAEGLPFLEQHAFNVGIAIGRKTSLEEVERIILALDERGLMAVVQPFLSDEEGVYANTENADTFVAWCRDIRDWLQERDLPVTWFVFDPEPAIGGELQEDLAEMFKTDKEAAYAWLNSRIADERFEYTRGVFADLVDELHQDGFKVMATPIPFIIDDDPEGLETIQRIMGTPIYGIDWDLVGGQLYGSGVGELSRGFIYLYSQATIQRFGDRAAAGLGLIGNELYEDPAEFFAGIGAAETAGLHRSRVYLFELAGILKQPTPGEWIPPEDLQTYVPKEDNNFGLVTVLQDQIRTISDDGGITEDNRAMIDVVLPLIFN